MYTDEDTEIIGLTNTKKKPQDHGYQTQHRRRPRSDGVCRFVVIISALLFTTIVLAWVMAMTESMGYAKRHEGSYLRYSTVTGYFLQDEEDTDAQKFDYVSTNFGLIERLYDHDKQPLSARHEGEEEDEAEAEDEEDELTTQWARFERQVRAMNSEAEPNIQYKVLYLGRHGEGFHNVAESWYGTDAWDCYWSLLDGNETMVWSDARLTDVGKAQAKTANYAWRKQIENQIPFPEMFYVSPLNRCLQTAFITFDELDKDIVRPFRPTVKESYVEKLVRETIGIHTCDRRSSRVPILDEYPAYFIEDGFSEDDLLWKPDLRESDSARNARIKQFLDDIFTSTTEEADRTERSENENGGRNNHQFISITAHSGAITSILEVIGHRGFQLQTGGVIPVFVRAERIPGREPKQVIDPPTGVPECKNDPLKAGGMGPMQVRETGVDV